MNIRVWIFITVCFANFNYRAQDTFSILAFDSITREVGAAGASCVDLFSFPGYSNDFICELFPDTGAIATQASYITQNQKNAAYRMRLGDSPAQLISWLQGNDAGSNPSVRQYGTVRLGSAYPQAAAHTGSNCMNYKNHRIGPNYTIHGNILLGALVLDSMESRFLREKGDLACKLMAAMQGANMIGADTRCGANSSSSLFAFLKVTLPTDTFGKPSFLVSLKTANGAGIEPIDSLQTLFDAKKSCVINTTSLNKQKNASETIKIFPNPVSGILTINAGFSENYSLKIFDLRGKLLYTKNTNQLRLEIDCRNWERGLYLLSIESASRSLNQKIFLE